MTSWVEPVESRVLFSSSLKSLVGTLDTRFAGGVGAAVVTLAGQQFAPASLVAQADGKLLVAGTTVPSDGSGDSDFLLLRLNPDGTPDASFGNGGRVMLDFQGTDDVASGAIQLADGKLLVFGSAQAVTPTLIADRPDTDLAVARLNADGSLDASFHATGTLVLDLTPLRFQAYGDPIQLNPTIDVANAAAQLPDGKLILAGTMFADDFLAGDMFALRLNADGSADASFGYNGTGLTPAPFGGDTVGNALLVQRDGRVVMAGADTAGHVTSMAVVRLKADGTFDPGFGDGGHVTFGFSQNFDSFFSLAQQRDGKLLAGGVVTFGSLNKKAGSSELALVRLDKHGRVDKSFGAQGLDGLVLTGLRGKRLAAVTSVGVQRNGDILVGGKAASTTAAGLSLSRTLFVARYTSKGELDGTFGNGGVSYLTGATGLTPAVRRNGVLIAGQSNNSVGTQAREMQYRAFLMDAEGMLAFTPDGDVRVLGSDAPAGGADSSVFVAAITPDGADLVGTLSPPADGTLVGGTKTSAELTVANAGSLVAKGRLKVAVYASRTRQVQEGDEPIYTAKLKANLKPGDSATYTLQFTLPKGLAAGKYHLVAVLNPLGGPIREITLDNNAVSARGAVRVVKGKRLGKGLHQRRLVKAERAVMFHPTGGSADSLFGKFDDAEGVGGVFASGRGIVAE